MTAAVSCQTLSNGLTCLVEPLQDVESAAFTLLVFGGTGCEPPNQNGLSAAACDWLFRGAGELDNRQFTTALDRMGLQRHETVSSQYLVFRGSCLARRLPHVLAIYSDILQRPRFDDAEFESVIAGVESNLFGVEDDPRQKALIEHERFGFPEPWNRPHEGTLADLPAVTADGARSFARYWLQPAQVVLAVAGQVVADEVFRQVENCSGRGRAVPVNDCPNSRFHLRQCVLSKKIASKPRSCSASRRSRSIIRSITLPNSR